MNARKFQVGSILVLGLTLAAASGCGGGPQVPPEDRRMIEALVTAVSAKNSEWLAANAKAVEDRKTSGSMGDAEHKKFREIIALGEAGQWDEAATLAYAWRDAQSATSEDLERVENRVAEPVVRKKTKPAR